MQRDNKGLFCRKDNEKVITGYKGFNLDMSCRKFQYEVGGTFESKDAKICETGFHFCTTPFDVFKYYPPATSQFAKVIGSGKIARRNDDSKIACSKMYIDAAIGLPGIISAGVKFILNRAKDNKEVTGHCSAATNTGHCSAATNTGRCSAATNTGYCSAATNTGDQSAATNTGHCSAATNTGTQSAATSTGGHSAATNTGDQSAATNTGYCSAATNTGDQSAATNTGAQSAATNTGTQSAATNTGYCSAATNTGDQSAATNTGYCSAATNTGDQSAATNTGDQSAATNTGEASASVVTGLYGRAKTGKYGCIALQRFNEDKDRYEMRCAETGCGDGSDGKLKASVYYILDANGNFKEA